MRTALASFAFAMTLTHISGVHGIQDCEESETIYRIVDLGDLPGGGAFMPLALNNDGMIVGRYRSGDAPNIHDRSFFWSPEVHPIFGTAGMIDLETGYSGPSGVFGQDFVAYDISDDGVIVGWSTPNMDEIASVWDIGLSEGLVYATIDDPTLNAEIRDARGVNSNGMFPDIACNTFAQNPPQGTHAVRGARIVWDRLNATVATSASLPGTGAEGFDGSEVYAVTDRVFPEEGGARALLVGSSLYHNAQFSCSETGDCGLECDDGAYWMLNGSGGNGGKLLSHQAIPSAHDGPVTVGLCAHSSGASGGWSLADSQCNERPLYWPSPTDSPESLPEFDESSKTIVNGISHFDPTAMNLIYAVGTDSSNNIAVSWRRDKDTPDSWAVEGVNALICWLHPNVRVGSESAAQIADPWTDLVNANDINGSGWIIGYGLRETSGFRPFLLVPIGNCPQDITRDGLIDVDDLLAVVSAWGSCGDGSICWSDVDGSGIVDVDDLLSVLSKWGNCQTVAQVPTTVTDCIERFGLDPVALEKCLQAVSQSGQ